MNIIKRHKGLAIVGGLSLVLVIILIIIFAKMIFSTSSSEYGQRLDGIENIKDSTLKDIKSELEENELVSSVSIRIQGKIIYTVISFVEGTSNDKAKSLATSIVSMYDEEVLEDYDFSFLLKEDINSDDEDKTGFVIAGTKIPSEDMISWTK